MVTGEQTDVHALARSPAPSSTVLPIGIDTHHRTLALPNTLGDRIGMRMSDEGSGGGPALYYGGIGDGWDLHQIYLTCLLHRCFEVMGHGARYA